MNDKSPFGVMDKIVEDFESAIGEGLKKGKMNTSAINILFDGPPGPKAGRFVEVENDAGASISIGEWSERDDGFWVLRIEELPL